MENFIILQKCKLTEWYRYSAWQRYERRRRNRRRHAWLLYYTFNIKGFARRRRRRRRRRHQAMSTPHQKVRTLRNGYVRWYCPCATHVVASMEAVCTVEMSHGILWLSEVEEMAYPWVFIIHMKGSHPPTTVVERTNSCVPITTVNLSTDIAVSI